MLLERKNRPGFDKIRTFVNPKKREIRTTHYSTYSCTIMTTVKNIIFDFGGVIHDIRYENVAEAFARHGVQNLSDYYGKERQTAEMDLFEKGLITPAQYRDYVRTLAGLPLSDDDIDDITNAILLDVPRERADLLRRLRQHYKVLLFSNTNQINYECFTMRLQAKLGYDFFRECFDAAYFSHQIHCRKPAPEGFALILKQQQLQPDETLFIDDIAANLDGARALGIHTYHLDRGTILDLFDAGGYLAVPID